MLVSSYPYLPISNISPFKTKTPQNTVFYQTSHLSSTSPFRKTFYSSIIVLNYWKTLMDLLQYTTRNTCTNVRICTVSYFFFFNILWTYIWCSYIRSTWNECTNVRTCVLSHLFSFKLFSFFFNTVWTYTVHTYVRRSTCSILLCFKFFSFLFWYLWVPNVLPPFSFTGATHSFGAVHNFLKSYHWRPTWQSAICKPGRLVWCTFIVQLETCIRMFAHVYFELFSSFSIPSECIYKKSYLRSTRMHVQMFVNAFQVIFFFCYFFLFWTYMLHYRFKPKCMYERTFVHVF